MKIKGENWNYPYILFGDNFIPIAVLLLIMIAISYIIILKIFCTRSKRNHVVKSKNIKDFFWGLITYGVVIVLLFAFAETDSQYILHKILVSSANALRQIDSFIYTLLLVLLLRGVCFKNHWTYYNRSKKYISYVNCVELCIVIFIQENVGEKGYMQLKVRFVIVGMIALINILLKDIEVENCSVNNSPMEDEKLFEVRQLQLEEIFAKIRTHNGEDQMTIFISDKWGGGKTFFMRKLFEELEKTKRLYPIWINMSDFNESEAVVRQILRKIHDVLAENDYYMGVSSEFEKYLQAILDIILDESIVSITKTRFDAFTKNELDESKTLSEISGEFSNILGEDRIIVLIDDVDRCTDEMIAQVVKLFSEILFLPKSIIIFAGDYKYLLGKKEFKNGFFDKYFMYNYNLKSVSYSFLMEYYQERYKNCELSNLPYILDVPKEVRKMVNFLKSVCQEQKKIQIDDQIQGEMRKRVEEESMALENNLETAIVKLEKSLSNPRRVIRIYNEIYDQLLRLNKIVKVEQIRRDILETKLREVIFPGILFYSFARTICIEHFWNICAEDFVDFEEDIQDMLSKINKTCDSETDEDLVYMLLVYYFFSTKRYNIIKQLDSISRYYKTFDIKILFL
ncbi:P-loop NTPase fold protein [Blautia sp. HCP3S3_D9]|uniref:P-loop NTPase fold protein n=1 Tax=Blautia sp. HCP3S3_D9 TaxID=3438912 RepID=UPI003F88872B